MVPLAFGTLLMVLAVYKAKDFWRLNGFRGSRLVRVLITDQLIYFVLYGHVSHPILFLL